MSQPRDIERTILPNGLTLITERMEQVRSVAMGVWINTGSRYESPEVNGISHFIEHMVFKGTHTRSARQIACEVDAIGGNLDAFTGKESICFNVKVLDEHAPKASEILADLVLHPVFAPEEITRERGVVLEEIKMDEDNPDYLVHELFVQKFWGNHPLGRPILGTNETVQRFERDTLFRHYGEYFRGGNMILSAAGNLEHKSFVEQISRRFEGLAAGRTAVQQEQPKPAPRIEMRNKKSLEQVQLCLGVPAPPIGSEDRYTTLLLNAILGGGMSSRLFQTVREEHGLAYAIYSDLAPYRDTGSLCVNAGTSAEHVVKMVELVMAQFRAMKQEPVTQEELRRAKDQIKGNLLLSLESSMARMSNLARQQMYFNRFFSFDEIQTRIEAVTAEEIQRSAEGLFETERIAVTLLGRLDGAKITREHLVC